MGKPFRLRPFRLLFLLLAALLVACQSPAIGTPNVVAPATIGTAVATPELTAGETGQTPLASPTLPLATPNGASPTQGVPNVLTDTPVSTPVVISAAPLTVTVGPLGGEVVDGYRVVNVYPHDRSAFTEGLVYVDGILFEGTGLDNHEIHRGSRCWRRRTWRPARRCKVSSWRLSFLARASPSWGIGSIS